MDSHCNPVIDIIFYCQIEKTQLNVSPSAREVSRYHWLTSDEIMKASLASEWLKKYILCVRSMRK